MILLFFQKMGTTHIRGGDPGMAIGKRYQEWYYPHTWGWSLNEWQVAAAERVLPTYVGVILLDFKPSVLLACTTHIRGGDPAICQDEVNNLKYYPHTWGWSLTQTLLSKIVMVLPTYVGVILTHRFICIRYCSTTHIRGGDPKSSSLKSYSFWYYPHTWGWS